MKFIRDIISEKRAQATGNAAANGSSAYVLTDEQMRADRITLSLRGSTYTVQFRRPAITARPAVTYADPLAADPYEISINLRTVA